MRKVKFNQDLYRDLANCIRVLTVDAVEAAKSGHPGMPLGMADVATVLFAEFLNFNPKVPKWENRDRFILSAGHGSMLLYSLLYLTGYNDITLDDIKNFRKLGSKAAGHPEYGHLDGVECTTGPLGQGLANAVGMAISRKMQAERIGEDIINHKTYVIVGDGCLMEGISHESASLAGHLKLNGLVVLFDSNNITIDGKRDLSDSEDTLKRFLAYGWSVDEADGHDVNQIRDSLERAKASDRPHIIKFNTTIGFGSPNKAGKNVCHGSPLGTNESLETKKSYNWDFEQSFFIPDHLLDIWRNQIGTSSVSKYHQWQEMVRKLGEEETRCFNLLFKRNVPEDVESSLVESKKLFSENKSESTRSASRRVLEILQKYLPNLCGGSADLSESNCTKLEIMQDITSNDFSGNYINYGIREHAMGAIMNGISLYGGIIPYAGTFWVFSDYAKPAIRLSAIMNQRVIYVMTHDSIGVGEDGPTHHPIEHLAALRAMPNINVLRPADGVETAECWHIAVESLYRPTVLCLTRQNILKVRQDDSAENLSKLGAYILSEFSGKFAVTIFASGSEVEIAMEAKKILEEKQIGTRVVSVPSMNLFEQQDQDYQNILLENSSVKVAIEAGSRFGWDRYIGHKGIFIGMKSFGASAPAKDLYKFFGITAEMTVEEVLKRV